MPETTKRQRYERIAAGMRSERTSFDAHWRDIADYMFPMKPRFTLTDRNRGDRRNQKIIDETATFAASTLRSGLHAGLTSPARPWMKLSTPDPDLAKFPPVASWLFDVTQRLLTVFQLSNLYKVLPGLYGDMGVFGTAAVGVLDDPGDAGRTSDLFRCYQYPIGSYWIDLDNRGLPAYFLREYIKTVENVVEEFGGPDGRRLDPGQTPDWSRFSSVVKRDYEAGFYQRQVEVCWMVMPNHAVDRTRLDARAFPWLSCHFEKAQYDKESPILREAGYYEFPVLAPTWERSAEDIYGTECPGMTALSGVKQLQSEQKLKNQAIAKMVHPPLQAPHSVMTQKVSALPSDITYVEDGPGHQGIRPIYEVKPDLQYMVLDIQEVQQRIERAFFVDLFRMLSMIDASGSKQPITAEEVRAREQEKLMQLGPVLESTNDELLDPLVDRVYAMMDRAGLIPPPPPDLDGVDLTVEYISILAQAQKLTKVAPLDGFLLRVGGLVQTHPDVRHKVADFEVVNEYADAFGVNPKLLRSDDDAQARAQQDAEALRAQQEAQQAESLAKAAHAAGTTPMGGDTALDRLVQGVA